jgi:hypothetical protein
MQTYTIADPLKTFTLPESWAEVSISQYMDIVKNTDTEYADITAVAIMSGIDKEFWKDYDNYPFFAQLVESLSFLTKHPDFVSTPKNTFKFKSKTYDLPTDPFFGTVGQYEDMKSIAQKIQADIENVDRRVLLDSYSIIARSFLYPIISGKKYDFKEVLKCKKEYEENLSIEYALQLTGFFFKRLNGLKVGTKAYSRVMTMTSSTTKIMRWLGLGTKK